MRKIKARKATHGYILPAPTTLADMIQLGQIVNVLQCFTDYTLENNVSNGHAEYKLYTNDDTLASELDALIGFL